MTSSRLLRNLIKTGIEGTSDDFQLVAEEVINEERKKQHHLLANDLERLLFRRPQAVRPLVELHVPSDRETGVPLLDVRTPARRLDDLCLEEPARQVILRVLQEHRRAEELATYGIPVAQRLLFFGPPGCGKTVAAEAIAFELDRPLAILRLDAVVSSLLGETATNLRAVFEFIENVPSVLLLDEFDAMGGERAGKGEHGEMRRVVNTILMLMDQYRGESLIIGATNFAEALDRALWRRFEEVVKFNAPDERQASQLILSRTRAVRREVDIEALPLREWFKGWSYADIERICSRAIKNMVLAGDEFLCRRHFDDAYLAESFRRDAIR